MNEDNKNVDREFWKEVVDVVRHTVVLALTIGSIALIKWELDHWLSKDFKLFDSVPLSYITDLGHALAIVRYLWSLRIRSKAVDFAHVEADAPKEKKAKKVVLDDAPSLRQFTIVEHLIRDKARRGGIAMRLLLIPVALCCVEFVRSGEINFGVISISFFLLTASYLNREALHYRIRQGLYATNNYEAREFLTYIVNNSDKEDFPGDDGLRQSLFQPEPEEPKLGGVAKGIGELDA